MGTVDESYGDDTQSKRGPSLMFDDQVKDQDAAQRNDRSIDMFRGENLRKMALQNLKDRRQR